MRSRSVRLALVTVLAVLLPQLGSAQSFFSTSTANNGTADPNWTVSTVLGGGFSTAAFLPAFTSSALGPDWISNNSTGSNGGIPAPDPYFVFRQTFDLTGFDPSTADLKFTWGCDDVPSSGAVTWTPVFKLNGGADLGSGTCGAYTYGSTVDLFGGFVAGINTLDFYVVGNGQTDGMKLHTESFTATTLTITPTTAPEPAATLLFATGLISIVGVVALRRKVA